MTVVTFRTKTEVFDFLQDCKNEKVRGTLIPLPKEIKLGCGLCVQISQSEIYLAYGIIKRGYFPTFNGIFTIKRVAGKTTLTKKI